MNRNEDKLIAAIVTVMGIVSFFVIMVLVVAKEKGLIELAMR